VPIERSVANVNLDCLSVLYPLREMVAFGAEHSTLDSTLARVAKRLGVTLAPDPFPQEVFFVRSDPYSFVRRGVPSLFPFMGLRSDSGVDAVARFKEWFANRYHTPQDDLGQPMQFEPGARHAELVSLLGLEIANEDERPAWKRGTSSTYVRAEARGDDHLGPLSGGGYAARGVAALPADANSGRHPHSSAVPAQLPPDAAQQLGPTPTRYQSPGSRSCWNGPKPRSDSRSGSVCSSSLKRSPSAKARRKNATASSRCPRTDAMQAW
jgi:hypothetical protein